MAAEPDPNFALEWRKSSASQGSGECAEVTQRGASILVRDSRDPSGTVLSFGPRQWGAFLSRVQSGAKEAAKANDAAVHRAH
jgi:hypothetical protein